MPRKKIRDRGRWLQTLTGGRFYPDDPQPKDIRIEDIAGALGRLCRYGGHCLRFYSVAEHCVHIARAAPPEHRLAALMHDASEAYLVDIPRPVKPYLNGYYDLEDRIMTVIAARFRFAWPMPPEVKHLDNAILADERAQNMAPMKASNAEWGAIYPPLGVELQFWPPDRAAFEFDDAFRRIMAERGA